MFKSATVLPVREVAVSRMLMSNDLAEKLADFVIQDPQGGQLATFGFSTPPHFGNTPLVFDCATGGRVIQFEVRERVLPSSAVKKMLRERVSDMQQRLGRRLGRKELLGVRDEVIAEMLPAAFIKATTVLILITKHYVFVGTTSTRMVDAIRSVLLRVLPGCVFGDWNKDFIKGMTALLAGADAVDILVGKAAVLKDDVSVVRLKDVDLDTEAIAQYISEGFTVRELALDDDVAAFSVAPNMVLRRIKLNEFTSTTAIDATEFDATVAIFKDALLNIVDKVQFNMPSVSDADEKNEDEL